MYKLISGPTTIELVKLMSETTEIIMNIGLNIEMNFWLAKAIQKSYLPFCSQVTFVGEEGLDAGGVRKEFFMLLLRNILNPDFGMFVEDEESHLVWFREQVRDY